MYYIQFLVEDNSTGCLIKVLMDRIIETNSDVSYDCKAFHGIGGYAKKSTVQKIKSGKLLNDLPIYLRGFNKSLQNFPAAIFIVLDVDRRNIGLFRNELEQIATENKITVDHVFCIAVEEMEAWLLGDEQAIVAAYPYAKLPIIHAYDQDSICGTWEILADAVYPGGLKKLLKENSSQYEIGKQKASWASNIGLHMNIRMNRSPSFNYFISALDERIPTMLELGR